MDRRGGPLMSPASDRRFDGSSVTKFRLATHPTTRISGDLQAHHGARAAGPGGAACIDWAIRCTVARGTSPSAVIVHAPLLRE